jgi:hypothetical protein
MTTISKKGDDISMDYNVTEANIKLVTVNVYPPGSVQIDTVILFKTADGTTLKMDAGWEDESWYENGRKVKFNKKWKVTWVYDLEDKTIENMSERQALFQALFDEQILPLIGEELEEKREATMEEVYAIL